MKSLHTSISIVILTYNCDPWIKRTLDRLLTLPGRAVIIAVDNGSTDTTLGILYSYEDRIKVVAIGRNIGAAARNVGVSHATTPYVAFADDDTIWEPHSLNKCVQYFDLYPKLTVINAKIVVRDEGKLDPISEEMAHSPLVDSDGLPGQVLLSFMGGATAMRREAFVRAGGYEEKLFLGGEEELLASEIVRRGGQMRYLDDIVVRHYPSNQSAAKLRPYGIRNALWFAWRRRSLGSAIKWTRYIVRSTPKRLNFVKGIAGFFKGLPWVIRTREPLPEDIERQYKLLDEQRIGASTRSYK
ncbi:MAG: glycosyltransferase [Candidatus Saccharibacteria bacterium]|nr:glycosyltransferase [Candidatus Saccharibacteria bacterium]